MKLMTSKGVIFLLNILIKKIKQLTRKQMIIYSVIVLGFLISIVFVNHNYAFYERPIAKVIKITVDEEIETIDQYQNEDKIFTQKITAELKNGKRNGDHIHLLNKYSLSCA